jgi:hypothetical protein
LKKIELERCVHDVYYRLGCLVDWFN